MSAIDELQIGAGEVHTIVADIKWDTETRSKESRTIGGYAAVHNSRSEFLGFGFETLKPGCFRGALNKPGSDQFLLYAHDETRVLARRSAGTLRLSEDAKGLRFEADIVDTQDGRDCLTLARTGH
ncbi:MAG: HK97 family phage prohead protease, partial [Solirubrobacteraceae bacterium]